MARKPNDNTAEISTKKDEPRTEKQVLESHLQREKKFHYNFEDPVNYIVSSGSLIMDAYLKGFGPGFHRFMGPMESGKSSEALTVLSNFLVSVPSSKGIYVKSEGRLSPEIQKRSGLKFVYSHDAWEDGTVFVYECNVYESVANLMTSLCDDNPNKKRYCFIIDSIDGLSPLADLDKAYKDSNKVAGGAVIASNMSRRLAIPFTKRGHMAILISQVRSNVPIDSYGGAPLRQVVASGGNALMHYPDMIWQFEPRFNADRILLHEKDKDDKSSDKAKADPLTNPIIGHWVKVTIKKSPHEKSEMTFRYPVKYGRHGGRSIWIEKEIFILLISWGMIERKASWLSFEAGTLEQIRGAGFDFPDTVQGEANFFAAMEKDPKLVDYLFATLKPKLADAF